MKHAEASQITVQLLEGNQELTIMVKDNGKGFVKSVVVAKKDNAFHTLITRTQSLNAEYEIDSHEKSGTTVMVWIPIL